MFDVQSGLRAKGEWRWGGPVWTACSLLPADGPLVVGDTTGQVRVFDPENGRVLASATVHTNAVTVVVPLAEGWFLSGGHDGQLAVCRLSEGSVRVEGAVPFDRPVAAVVVAADNRTVAVLLAGERQARLWRLDHLNAAWAALGLGLDLPPPGSPPPPPAHREPPPSSAVGNGLWREVFSDPMWAKRVSTGLDAKLSHDWKGGGPHPAVGDAFAAEWRGHLTPPAAGRYRFRVDADDRAALYLDGRPVAVKAGRPGERVPASLGEVELPAGGVPIRVGFANASGAAWMKVEWLKLGPGGFDWRDIDPRHLSPHPPK